MNEKETHAEASIRLVQELIQSKWTSRIAGETVIVTSPNRRVRLWFNNRCVRLSIEKSGEPRLGLSQLAGIKLSELTAGEFVARLAPKVRKVLGDSVW